MLSDNELHTIKELRLKGCSWKEIAPQFSRPDATSFRLEAKYHLPKSTIDPFWEYLFEKDENGGRHNQYSKEERLAIFTAIASLRECGKTWKEVEFYLNGISSTPLTNPYSYCTYYKSEIPHHIWHKLAIGKVK